jgi:hypothetical protein
MLKILRKIKNFFGWHLLKELRKIDPILDWHPDFDIKKLIRAVIIRRNIIYSLFALLLIISISFNVILIHKNNKIDELKQTASLLENTLWVNNDIKDSLMNIIESSGYLKYWVKSEAKIDIPNYVPKDHLKYMFERAIDKKIPISILFRLIYKESSFDSTALSPRGAYGYMQVMPLTYKAYCRKLNIEPYPITVKKNVFIGTWFLAEMYDYWHMKKPKLSNDIIWNYAIATYNMGIGNMNDGLMNDSIQNYINFITE